MDHISIMLDNQQVSLPVKPGWCLADILTAIDYALLRDNYRIRTVFLNGNTIQLTVDTLTIPVQAVGDLVLQSSPIAKLTCCMVVLGKTAERHRWYAERYGILVEQLNVSDDSLDQALLRLLCRYDRLLVIDQKVCFSKIPPNLFDVFPRDRICLMNLNYEDKWNCFGPLALLSWLQRAILLPGRIDSNSSTAIRLAFEDNMMPYCLIHEAFISNDISPNTPFHFQQGFVGNDDDCYLNFPWLLRGNVKGAVDTFIPYVPDHVPSSYICDFDRQEHDDITKNVSPVLEPFFIRHEDRIQMPIGDIVMMLPIARQTGMAIYLPHSFSGDFINELLDDTVNVVRKQTEDMFIIKMPSMLVGSPEALLWVKNWESPELVQRFGFLNATLAVAKAIGLTLADPCPRLQRPAGMVKKRVLIVADGSVIKRSMTKQYRNELVSFLGDNKYNVEILGHCNTPRELAEKIASAEYVISVPTGPLHIAAAMGIKSVMICVGDSSRAYRPLQQNVKVLSTGCDRCWFDKGAGGRVCGDDNPLCQRSFPPDTILAMMKELDNEMMLNQTIKA